MYHGMGEREGNDCDGKSRKTSNFPCICGVLRQYSDAIENRRKEDIFRYSEIKSTKSNSRPRTVSVTKNFHPCPTVS